MIITIFVFCVFVFCAFLLGVALDPRIKARRYELRQYRQYTCTYEYGELVEEHFITRDGRRGARVFTPSGNAYRPRPWLTGPPKEMK